MQLDIYDTYASTANGGIIHFDVLLASSDTNEQKAKRYAQDFIAQIGESVATIKLDRCDFCHTETANPIVKEHVAKNGYFILQMEGCPNPYNR